MSRAQKFNESALAIGLEKLNDPNDSGIQVWSFPSHMEKYGAAGALIKMEGFLVRIVRLKNPELKVQAEKFKMQRCQLGSTA